MGAADSEATVILGGSGFLGAHAVSMALRRADIDHPVVSVSREPRSGPLFGRQRSQPQFERSDAREPAELLAALEGWRPARVINCLALARGDDCEEDPLLASLLNAQVPGQLARWCRRNGSRLVHVSTDLVFGDEPPPSSRGFCEDDPPAPISAYGATKAAGEEAVLNAFPQALVVRLPLLYGASGGRELGASDSFLGAVERGDVPCLFSDEWRTPLLVEDAAGALLELAWGTGGGVLHVSGPDRVSRLQLGLALLIASGLAPGDAQVRVRAGRRGDAGLVPPRPEDTSLDSTRARSILRTRLRGVREGAARACAP
ncbi:MAG: SDR family oxidoreductase [Planctomycetota bacterium]|nr:SDR family oxidoreductase [Planctomycetota bacterium]MDP6761735.1 SDR family oxidoreductase [Planctomycetota bacterium]MDP6990257.1 SDR family oxidoreductase [Planctomycetota bacterium]